MEATINHIDAMNPSIGYEVVLIKRGQTILRTAVDPSTGHPLLTFDDCVRVLSYYAAK